METALYLYKQMTEEMEEGQVLALLRPGEARVFRLESITKTDPKTFGDRPEFIVDNGLWEENE
jgi:hypothetical protein